MSRKIESIIECCSDCKHCEDYLMVGSNCDFAIVCTHDEHKQLLGITSQSKRYLGIEIPSDCPLSDAE